MPNGDDKQPNKRQLWNAYGAARRMHRKGAPLAAIQRMVQKHAGMGLIELEETLGIGDPTEPLSRWERVQGAAREVKQGLTLGWSDELEGRIADLIPGGMDAEGYRAREAERRADFRSQHPGSATLGHISGGAALGTLTAGAMGAMAPSTAAAGGPAPHMLGEMVGSGAAGSLGGATYGGLLAAGEAEPGERLAAVPTGAGFGAMVGGGMGLLAPPVSAAFGRYVPSLLDRAPGGIGRGAAQRMRQSNPTAVGMAAREIDASLERVGIAATPEEIAARMNRLPARTRVMDLDPALGAQAMYATRRNPAKLARANGPARTAVARSEGTGARMANTVRQSAGIGPRRHTPGEVFKMKREIWDEELLQPLLRNGSDAVGSTQLGKLLKDHPIIKEFLRHQEGIQMAANPAHQTANVRQIWRTRQNMQAKLRDIYNNPGKTTWEPETIEAAIQALDEVAEGMHPGLGRTIRTYAQIKAEQRAREAGQKLVNARPGQIRETINSQNTPEEAAYVREGLIDALEDRLVKRSGGGATGRSLMDLGGEDLTRLRYLYPEGQAGNRAFQSLMDYLKLEGMINESTRQLARVVNAPLTGESAVKVGYITTERAMANDLLRQVLEDPTLERVAAGHVGDFFMGRGDEAAELLRNIQGSARDATKAGIARGRIGGLVGEQLQPDRRRRSLLPIGG